MKTRVDKKGFAIGVTRNSKELDFIKRVKRGSKVRIARCASLGAGLVGVVKSCTQKPEQWAGVWEVKLVKKIRCNPFGCGWTKLDTFYYSEDEMVLI